MWEDYMITSKGYIIPMILSIGNHETGGWGIDVKDVAFYLKYFPQENDSNIDPNLRSTYHTHEINNNTVIFVFDTDQVSSLDGDQLKWMKRQMHKYKNFETKLALYHTPMYPGATIYTNSRSQDILSNWGPVFDQYNLNTAFENHDHTYTRSKLMMNNKVNESGTLYVGSGSWGTTIRKINDANKWYLQNYAEKNFILSVNLDESNKKMNFIAIDSEGQIFDEFSRDIN